MDFVIDTKLKTSNGISGSCIIIIAISQFGAKLW